MTPTPGPRGALCAVASHSRHGQTYNDRHVCTCHDPSIYRCVSSPCDAPSGGDGPTRLPLQIEEAVRNSAKWLAPQLLHDAEQDEVSQCVVRITSRADVVSKCVGRSASTINYARVHCYKRYTLMYLR